MAETISAARIIDSAVRKLLKQREGEPLIVGLCGSQGSGKSTTCRELAEGWRREGLRVAVLSLDDLYLRRAERQRLARDVHPLLATRGVPGTHDVSLGIETLQALREHGRVKLPRFDKAVDDRSPDMHWDEVQAPVEIILFEGWCVGARPQDPSTLVHPINALESHEDSDGRWRNYVNEQLQDEYQMLFAQIDHLVLLAAPSFDVVLRWRTQQERELAQRRDGPGVMNDAALIRFVQHYERLTRHVLDEMRGRADLVIALDENRTVLSTTSNN
jgi:D-glycerate 3-kinase